MERERFEELVAAALEGLPPPFAERLENIAVTVQDWPTRDQLAETRVSHRENLLGLYEGIPLPKRGRSYNMVLPDKITIFQRPIEMHCRSDAKIIRQIRDTVQHEIAHYFGISDARLRELRKY
ncbi:metallopeptidase family protein [Dehalococcoidia bacterium]|nr:metallopeptidase family protein [Dehalococcoidia bacterium]MCL0029478.1 metallopeptidase family protein [Dehalococcoidia bacterium]MCL0047919.1 metallopeptidase family protein [Dehalococcoidia bacterium]MCL0059681.1 metallopeptidase family protein [Dehalococcoidia bacterium]MCL0064965.1 metallopeptidase family protein [Dehalococcoidia bacterium]